MPVEVARRDAKDVDGHVDVVVDESPTTGNEEARATLSLFLDCKARHRKLQLSKAVGEEDGGVERGHPVVRLHEVPVALVVELWAAESLCLEYLSVAKHRVSEIESLTPFLEEAKVDSHEVENARLDPDVHEQSARGLGDLDLCNPPEAEVPDAPAEHRELLDDAREAARAVGVDVSLQMDADVSGVHVAVDAATVLVVGLTLGPPVADDLFNHGAEAILSLDHSKEESLLLVGEGHTLFLEWALHGTKVKQRLLLILRSRREARRLIYRSTLATPVSTVAGTPPVVRKTEGVASAADLFGRVAPLVVGDERFGGAVAREAEHADVDPLLTTFIQNLREAEDGSGVVAALVEAVMYTVVEILRVIVLEADVTLPTLFDVSIIDGSLDAFEALVVGAPMLVLYVVEGEPAGL